MRRLIFTSFIAISLTFILAACGEADIEGIIIDSDEEQITLAQNLSPEEYEEIEAKSEKKIQNDDVILEKNDYNLIILIYGETEKFNKGDEVEAWIEDEVMASYPGQAKAKKIRLKK